MQVVAALSTISLNRVSYNISRKVAAGGDFTLILKDNVYQVAEFIYGHNKESFLYLEVAEGVKKMVMTPTMVKCGTCTSMRIDCL